VGFNLGPGSSRSDSHEDGVSKERSPDGKIARQPKTQSNSRKKPKSDVGKTSSNHILHFPVVKDPNNPETRLRLSQQTNSQQSDDSLPKKHVSFEPVNATSRVKSSYSNGSTSSSGSRSTITDKPKLLDLQCASRPQAQFFIFKQPPPLAKEVVSTMDILGLPNVVYQDAYYSNDKDVPSRAREYAGKEFRIESNTVPYLPDFDATGTSQANFGIKSDLPTENRKDEQCYKKARRECSLRNWEIMTPPPSLDEVKTWWTQKQNESTGNQGQKLKIDDPELRPYLSQIDGPTPKNKHGFEYSH
jgi:DNA polymerase zeta